ncbi:MAG: hypothetical protein CMH38_11160 [Microbacterium sp.]|jgi:hypothetical protein|uniref:DUF4386 domain-containing protein n=1 Tax=unclassified Microbacterium TaxID=2609290 RepID=UPI000C4DE72E|nr:MULTISPECIES: DUF4386 domain-containing protein [unclassified Microbacterium]MAY50460.1 hypothetical protein [Microbacterium sp.]HAM14007.1 DUF4386 domain-containing protein [Microbacterium sp.]HAS33117.1 DUF4386 domain-containing protein [Microbacterium sp.]HBR88691.1 DUF4386 domain-containing protein [Microbacterium sp.]HBS75340.1 DUF4386 domain-containing protein [Microbacterium sp.]|tara:strand:+ start:832 stop:1560 length:729 start_codon:yes stop_codon:yes gene_type:complete
MSTITPIDTTRRTAARVAGAGYLGLFVLAIFANFVVKQGLIDASSAETTVANIQAQEGLFRVGLTAFVVVFLIDIAVAWALYVLFAPAGRTRSLLVAWFRLIYTVFLGVGAVFMFLGLQVANGTTSLGADAALLMFEAFDFAWFVGLIAFGGHLVLLGVLIIRSGLAPRLIGGILIVAGAAYAVDTLAHILVTDYAAISSVMLGIVAIPSIVAEVTFTIWLLLSGRRSSATTREEPRVPVLQ